MDIIHACCAGLDVHKKTVVACVRRVGPDGAVSREVRTFGTMTARVAGPVRLARGPRRSPGRHGIDRGLLEADLQSAGRRFRGHPG